MQKKKSYRKAVFIVTYAKEKGKIEYLLLKRKMHWSGWEFPKGGVEQGERFSKTAIREVLEETGREAINVKNFKFSGKYDYKRKYPDRPGYDGQSYALFAVEVKKGKVKIGREHSKHLWLDYDKAYKKLRFYNQKKCLKLVNDWLEKNEKRKV